MRIPLLNIRANRNFRSYGFKAQRSQATIFRSDSRPVEESAAIRRRRECEKCEFRFSTYEQIEILDLTVLKRNGARQPYSDLIQDQSRNRQQSGGGENVKNANSASQHTSKSKF